MLLLILPPALALGALRVWLRAFDRALGLT